MKLLLVPALAAILLASPPIHATPLDDRIAELKHAVEKEAASRANGNNPQFGNPGMNPAFIDATIDQVVAQMDNPAYGNMEAQLAQITSMYSSTEVQEATTNLLNEFKKERKEKTDAEIANVKALLTRAGTAITQAKKPEDLDGLIEEMSKHANNQYGGNSALQGDQPLLRQFSGAYEFVKQWQNYLAHLANGQTDEARADLQNLSQNNEGAELMPRSKMLELTAPDKLAAMANKMPAAQVSPPVAQAQALLDGMKSLEDMEPTLKKLAPLRQNNAGVQMAANELSPMVEVYENIKAGLPVQANLNFGYRPSEVNVPAAIRTQLLLFTLQSRFAAFKGTPPAPGERPVDFVDRVIADATSRQDWDLLRNAASARATLTPNSGVGYATYTGGIDSIIAGAHLETAGQFALAVRAYEQALQGNDPAIPAKILGDKLAAIQRDHPKEFADGMQLTVNPPAPRYPTYPGRLPGMPYQMPGTTTNAAPTPAAPPTK